MLFLGNLRYFNEPVAINIAEKDAAIAQVVL